MKCRLFLLLGVAAFTLGACADGSLINSASNMKPTGSAFSMALHKEYVTLAKAEQKEGDHMDAAVFARRAKTAGSGKSVSPDNIFDRGYSNNNRATLLNARAKLEEVLDAGGAKMNPGMMAKAQSQFDCWAQELEENTQPKDIAKCKKGFTSSIGILENSMAARMAYMKFKSMKPKMKAAPKKMAKKKGPRKPANFVVYFDFDSAGVNDDARAIIKDAAAAAVKSKSIHVRIIGHTDTAGSRRYNEALSERRTKAVDKVLGWEGVNPLIIEPNSMGESDLADQTGDSVKSFQNRRVTVTVF
ncbi:MAG: OmpA family protein [Alphaproteobacteria bacterium]|nr:OmpA family protein [Alphaproteobacteria bacterium]